MSWYRDVLKVKRLFKTRFERAKLEKKRILEQADVEIQGLKQKAQLEIEAEKREAQENLRVQVAELAVDLASKLFWKIWTNKLIVT